MERDLERPKRKKRVMSRKKRTLDPSTVIDYKHPDVLKRFITERGKIIPRRVSGANSAQQRELCTAIKRARFLALIPTSISHLTEKGFSGEMAAATIVAAPRDHRRFDRNDGQQNNNAAPEETSGEQQG